VIRDVVDGLDVVQADGVARMTPLRPRMAVRSQPVSRRAVLATVLASLLLAGCFTGPRPYFGDTNAFPPGSVTGDTAIDAVLTLFDAVSIGPATATYSVLTKFGNTTHPATVVLTPGKRAITIGNIRYVQTETTANTCTQDNSVPCVTGFDPQRISDIGITVDFYAADTAKRLRRDAQAKLGPAIASQATIAGQPATCVDITLPGGVATYCSLANGMLAKLDDGDVQITLTAYGAAADPVAFQLPG
jgi:FlaG/FlaF family flagellin (archaellin)